MTDTCRRLRGSDYLLLTVLATMLFGYSAISGKPLTMHEARLPQNAREMLASGQWLLPRSGERPWLERPPLPHWVMLLEGRLAGRLDQVWIVRIPPAVMGWGTLLLTAWTGTRLLGRRRGLLSAIALAGMYEFYFYAGQAEEDVFLAFLVAAAMACFVAAEFPSEGPRGMAVPAMCTTAVPAVCSTGVSPVVSSSSSAAAASSALEKERSQKNRSTGGTPVLHMGKMPMPRFLGNRPPAVWLFFVAVGLTSLVKGPLIGAVEAGAAVATFLALTRDWGRILRYVWLWGWLLFVAVTSAWYLYAYHVYPSIWDNFRYDLAGSGRSEPFWYYAAAIGWTTSPLTPLWIVGLVLTWRGARADRAGPNRFLWCWWLAPLIVLSLPARKHHHYLVPVLGAFAVLAGVGMDRIGAWIGSAKARRGLVPLGLFAVALPGAAAIALLGWWQKIPGPLWATLLLAAVFFACAIAVSVGLSGRSGRWVLAGLLAGLTVFAAWGQSVLATSGRNRNLDIYFLARVRQVAAPDIPLLIDTRGPADMGGSLEFFRQQFYLPAGTVPLQNLTFLRDQRISADKVYVLTRYRCRSLLSAFGSWRIIEESGQKATAGPSDHYALFLLTFAPGLERYPAPPISVMQALGQAAGPTCGPPLPPGEGETPAP